MAQLIPALLVGLVAASAGIVHAQAPPDAGVAFDVVSVKPNTSGDPGLRLDVQPGGRLVAVNIPLKQFIRAAYSLQLYQIEGAPRWSETDRFDITAVTERGFGAPVVWTPGSYAPAQRMMQSVLADRFRMKGHMNERESPGYVLEIQSPGSTAGKLVPAEVPCRFDCTSQTAAGTFRGRNVPLLQFAELLSQLTGRFVTEATGLAGTFDFELQWAPESQAATDAPSLFTALREQLGLRLTPRRVRTPVLVIDAIGRPDAD